MRYSRALCPTHGDYWRRGATELCPTCVREQRSTAIEDARARAVLAASELTGRDSVATQAVMRDAEWKALRDQVWGITPPGEIEYWNRVVERIRE